MVDLGNLFDKIGMDGVGDTVEWVVDNKDALGTAIDFIRDLDVRIPELIRVLPGLLASLGGGLAEAGEQAQRAAVTPLGDDGEGGASAVLGRGAEALSGMTDQLGSAATMLSGVADDVGKVGIPSFEAKYTDVVGFRGISGVEIETSRILEGPAEKLKSGADSVTDVTSNLGSLAEDLTQLAAVMGTIGQALDGLGERLGSSGQQIRGLTGGPDVGPPKGPSAVKARTSLPKSPSTRPRPRPSPGSAPRRPRSPRPSPGTGRSGLAGQGPSCLRLRPRRRLRCDGSSIR